MMSNERSNKGASYRRRSSVPCRSDAWANFFLSYPLQRALSRSDGDRIPELLLHHSNVHIRSPQRSALGSWTWSPRQIALIRPPSSSGRCRCSVCSAPVVLLYDRGATTESPSLPRSASLLPTGAARLLRASRSGLSVSSTSVSGRPRHVELAATAFRIVGDGEYSDVFAGFVDLPRKKRSAGAGKDSDEVVKYVWRVKFPDEETAMLWRDMLSHALQMRQPAQIHTSDDASGNAHGNASPPPTNHRSVALLDISIFGYSGGVFFQSIFAIGVVGYLIEWAITLAENAADFRSRDDVIVGEEELTKYPLFTPVASGVVKSVLKNQIINKPGTFFSREMFTTSDYAEKVIDSLPKPQSTPYRKMVSFLFNYSELIRSVQFWLAALASIVLLVSAFSLSYQTIPEFLLPVRVWRAFRDGGLGLAVISLAAALCHDSYVNHLTPPIRHGLYWRGWVQCMVSFGLLMLGKTATRRALGLPAVRQLSPARSASAGVSGFAVTSAVPLALSGIHAMNDGRKQDALLTWTGALLVFLVGLYFLGRSVRHMTAFGGIPFGMYLHRSSLFPARLCYASLSFAGDLAHIVVRKIVHPLTNACYQMRYGLFFAGDLAHIAVRKIVHPLTKACYQMRYGLFFAGDLAHIAVRTIVHPLTKACYQMRYGLLQIVAPTLRLLRLLGDSAHQVAVRLGQILIYLFRQCLTFVKTFGTMQKRLLSSTCDAIIPIVMSFLHYLFRLVVLPGLRSLQTAARVCFSGAIQFARLAKRVLTFACHNVVSPISDILGSIFYHVVTLLGKTFNKLAAVVGLPMVAICDQFIKRYWKLIPVFSILNGSLIFVRASVSAGIDTVAMVQYLLGAWALLLIGLTIANEVLTTVDVSLMRQHIKIADSVLLHIDLHIGYFLIRTVMSGWHALSTALRLALHAVDIAIRQSFGYLWKTLTWLHTKLFRGASYLFDTVWNSPIFGLIISSASLWALYLLRIEAIHFPNLFIPAKIHAVTAHGYFEVCFTTSFSFFFAVLKPLEAPLLFVAKCFIDTYEPVLNVESSSPSSAFACWAFSCVIKWKCSRIRLKIFALPALYIYISGLAGADVVRVSIVSFAIWIVLSNFVDQYETEQRRLLDQALPSFVSERRQVPSDENAYEQSDCAICLESLGNVVSNASNVALPCGHQFHKACIEDWLQVQSRCPICRRATHGFDRILEVVF